MKYKSVKVEIDGHKFDSKMEGNRYLKLKELLKEKQIKDLELQPRFLLQPSFKKYGRTIRKIEYIADFKYYDNVRQKLIIEDVKGFETKDFKIKQKYFDYKYPELELELVKKVK